jgi:hypothetical protein
MSAEAWGYHLRARAGQSPLSRAGLGYVLCREGFKRFEVHVIVCLPEN